MPAKFADALNTHRYPGLLYRFPQFLRLLHFAVRATTLRTWYVRRSLTDLLGARARPFRYLDAGCGAGDFLFPFARRFAGSAFMGVDRAAGNVELGMRYAAQAGLKNVVLREETLESFVPDPPVDVIACITVLQYTDDRKVLRNFYEGLTEDGRLLLYVPVFNRRFFRWYEPLLKRYFHTAQYDTEQARRRIYTPEALYRKLDEAGFSVRSAAYAYGPAGQIYYEIYSLCLLLLASVHPLIALLLTPAFLLLYPVLLLLMAVDFLKQNRSGNGLLVLAGKR